MEYPSITFKGFTLINPVFSDTGGIWYLNSGSPYHLNYGEVRKYAEMSFYDWLKYHSKQPIN